MRVRMARGAQYPLCARVFAPSNLAKDHAQNFDIGAFERRACGGNVDPLFIFCGKPLAKPFGAGPLLLLFFLSAAVSAPIWAQLARAFGAKEMLQIGMILLSSPLVFAAFLGEGQVVQFCAYLLSSGVALGADMTLLPAIFARHLASTWGEGAGGLGFGLWAFVSKVSLALAAAFLLPLLQLFGYQAGEGQ